jgi:hypothetical protein
MKAKQYLVTSTVGHTATKRTWNSAVKHIVELTRVLARDAGTHYVLTDSESVKDGFWFISGSRSWTNQKNGCVVVFSIRLVDE